MHPGQYSAISRAAGASLLLVGSLAAGLSRLSQGDSTEKIKSMATVYLISKELAHQARAAAARGIS
jgi:hypothetical protein